MSQIHIGCLEEYVNSSRINEECRNLITELIDLTEPSYTVKVVYRGHQNSKQIRTRSWFSTSIDESSASHFMNIENTCCLFKINLDENVKYLIVNDVIHSDYLEEFEIIVKGGGKFYSDVDYTNEGFLDKGDGYFETWYKL